MATKIGRPHTDIPLDILDTACTFNANMNQLLMLLENKGIKTTDDTVNNFCKRSFGVTFSEYKDKRFDHTRLMLQQKAMQMGLEGNTTMLIFSLKNVCKWTDRVDVTERAAIPTGLEESSDDELDNL